MVCAKCQRNEATVHLTTILHGGAEETLHLCKDCGSELETSDPRNLEALPVIARKCEICGKDAFSGKTFADGSTVYWCFDCEAEYRRTFAALFVGEHREFMESISTRRSCLPFLTPQQFQEWSAETEQRIVQILKERHQGNARDLAS